MNFSADSSADQRAPAQPFEIDVEGEIASAISMAYDSQWSLGELEHKIKEHKGNFEHVFAMVSLVSHVYLSKLQPARLYSNNAPITRSAQSLPAGNKTLACCCTCTCLEEQPLSVGK